MTKLGICIGCISNDDWSLKPIKGDVGRYRDEVLGFCDSHID